jgi:hypothetical protein
MDVVHVTSLFLFFRFPRTKKQDHTQLLRQQKSIINLLKSAPERLLKRNISHAENPIEKYVGWTLVIR